MLLPNGPAGGVDWGAAAVGAAAVLALFRFRIGVIPLIAACAVIGLVRVVLLP